jgi:hypothetical protein
MILAGKNGLGVAVIINSISSIADCRKQTGEFPFVFDLSLKSKNVFFLIKHI